MVELMVVFGGVLIMLIVLLSYNNVTTMQRINNDLRNEIIGLYDKVHNLEFEVRTLDEAADILDNDLCVLGEAVNNYIEGFEPRYLDDLINIMDDLEDKYSDVDLEDSKDWFTKDGGYTDDWIRHVDLRECDPTCPICLEAEQTPVKPTLH